MWQNVDLTSVDHTWQGNSILFNTTCALDLTAPATADMSAKPGS